MTTDTAALRDELAALAEKATPGPWKFVPWHIEEGPSAIRAPDGWLLANTPGDADAALIVALRNNLPTILAALSAEPADGLREARVKALEALEPFACGDHEVPVVDGEGWTNYGISWSRDRIVDWFGPSDFRRAKEAIRALKTEGKQ
jgi:hypothetical protein